MMKFFLVSIFFLLPLSSDIKVYVSKDSVIEKITLQELRHIYLKKTKILQTHAITVLDNTESYDTFYQEIIKKSQSQIHAYWMKEIFSGRKVPPRKVDFMYIEKIMNNDPFTIIYTDKLLDAKVIYESK